MVSFRSPGGHSVDAMILDAPCNRVLGIMQCRSCPFTVVLVCDATYNHTIGITTELDAALAAVEAHVCAYNPHAKPKPLQQS